MILEKTRKTPPLNKARDEKKNGRKIQIVTQDPPHDVSLLTAHVSLFQFTSFLSLLKSSYSFTFEFLHELLQAWELANCPLSRP
jgi:hypothetical protein